MSFSIPKMYEEMPFPTGYFETDLNKMKSIPMNLGYDMEEALSYANKIGKSYTELSAAEMWMFAIDADGKHINQHYAHYKKTGEVLPYDGPKRTEKDEELLKQWKQQSTSFL